MSSLLTADKPVIVPPAASKASARPGPDPGCRGRRHGWQPRWRDPARPPRTRPWPHLVQVVGGGAVVADAVVGARVTDQVRRERRRGVAAGDQHHARVGDQRGRSHHRTRTRRADHTDHILVSRDGLGLGLAAVVGAQIVETGTQFHIEAVDRPVVVHRDPGGPIDRQAKKGHVTRDGVERTDLNGVTLLHLHDTQRAATQRASSAADISAPITAASRHDDGESRAPNAAVAIADDRSSGRADIDDHDRLTDGAAAPSPAIGSTDHARVDQLAEALESSPPTFIDSSKTNGSVTTP